MAEKTIIAWTGQTWNPWRGCTKVSPGCKNCYMFTAQERYGKDPSQVVRTKTWGDPLRWQKAAAAAGRSELVFTCSW
jgi:protein gp37